MPTLVTEMPLPTLAIEQPAMSANSTPGLEAARREHPWLARSDSGLVVHGYEAARDLMMMDDKMIPSFDMMTTIYGSDGGDWTRFMVEQLANRTGADHSRLRNSVAAAFTPRTANQYREVMRQVVTELLDEWVPRGRFDFAEFASYFPVSVMCRLLGTPNDEIPKVRNSLETQGAVLSLNPALLPDLLSGYEIMWDYADRLMKDREARGPSEESALLDELIAAKAAGHMTETELRDLLMILFVAGYDSSKNMIAMMMYRLLDYPEYWQRCAEDKAFCATMVEELLRDSTIATGFRTVIEDFVYDDILFPKGTLLIMHVVFAGRDPAAYEDPLTIRADRGRTNRHLAFGRGAHMCLGQHLARAQIEEGIHLMAQRIRNPRLTGEVQWRAPIGITGLINLPIEFDAALETQPA